MVNILIADDHQLLLEGIESMLSDEEDLQIVAKCRNGKEVLHRLQELDIDLILLDINMPRMNGIKVTEQIRNAYPQVKVIALSMYKQPSYINRMLNLGASGYVLKDDGKECILEAIRASQLGNQYLSENAKAIIRHQKSHQPVNLGITSREKEVLKELAKGMTSKEISETLYISFHTVKTHRKHLMRKFDVNNVSGLLSKAKDMGII